MRGRRDWQFGLDWHCWAIGFCWYPGSWGQFFFGPCVASWSWALPLDEMTFAIDASNDDSMTTAT